MQVREWVKIDRSPGFSIIAEYTTSNGFLTIDGTAGTVTLLIPPSDTAEFTPGTYVYDLEVESPESDTTRIIQGKFVVRAEVTK